MNRKSQKNATRRARIQVSAAAVAEARRQIEAEAAARRREEKADDWAEKIGAGALSCLRDMVAALNCDYERLDELREARADFDAMTALRDAREGFSFDEDKNAAPDGPGYKNDAEAWAGENPEDAAELARLEAAYRTDAEAWTGENTDDAEELKELEEAAGECENADTARERIEEDALSVEVRSDWTTRGEDMTAGEFCILLSTGGPATRIRGELDEHGQPSRAWLEVQDWFKPWTEYHESGAGDVCLAYAAVHFPGE